MASSTAAPTPKVPSLLHLCIKNISDNLHLYSCLHNLPTFIQDEIVECFRTVVEKRNSRVNDDNVRSIVELQALEARRKAARARGDFAGCDDDGTPPVLVGALNLQWSHKLTDEGLRALATTGDENDEAKAAGNGNAGGGGGGGGGGGELVELVGATGRLLHASLLTSVDLSFCERVGDAGVRALARCCPLLTHVCLCDCRKLTDGGVESLVRRCKRLESLSLELCTRVTDVGVQAVARGAKRTLCALNLGGCFKVTNVGISIVADHGQHLEVLNLGGCQLMDFDVEDICKKCVRLRVLDLRACCKITDASARAIGLLAKRKRAKGLCAGYGLRVLDLGGCSRLTDKGFAALLRHTEPETAELEVLDVRGCTFTDETLALFRRKLPRLTHLCVQRCKNVTPAGVATLKGALPKLAKLVS